MAKASKRTSLADALAAMPGFVLGLEPAPLYQRPRGRQTYTVGDDQSREAVAAEKNAQPQRREADPSRGY